MKRKPGKPVVHPPVLVVETGEIFKTYKEAAAAIGGDRSSIMRCCEGVQRHHKGFHFAWYIEGED